jgi:hypothetical protein
VTLFALDAPLAARQGAVTGALDPKRRSKTGIPGIALKPPRLFGGGDGGAAMWLGVLLLAVSAVACAAVATYVLRFLRGPSSS